jgi:hypothetical protein
MKHFGEVVGVVSSRSLSPIHHSSDGQDVGMSQAQGITIRLGSSDRTHCREGRLKRPSEETL